ncbi:M20/M25/M40 family metallo-hydrolase, partial [Streptomyces sp. SID7982]|nr:M20/M25/M40 family metallo-hydrolase [Streptomyces sp. SID7982]
DMKDMDAMTLAVVRERMRSGRKPPRDIVLAFLADEEAGGTYGARYLVDNHPGLFEGVTEAISEVGGFSFTVNENLRLYLVETAQKG